MSVGIRAVRNSPGRSTDAIRGSSNAQDHDCSMSTTLVLRLEQSKMSRLRDIVNDKADDLFSKLSRAEAAKNVTRAQGLTDALKFWDEIERALRDAQPEPVATTPSPLCAAANDMRAVLVKCFAHLGKQIEAKTLNESAADGTQSLSAEIARVLDAANAS